MLARSALLALLAAPPQGEVRLVGETLTGEQRTLGLAELPLADPRALGAWIVRPVGLSAAAPSDDGPRAELRLAGGDPLHGRITGGEGEFLTVELLGDVVLALAVDEIASFAVPALFPPRLDEPLVAPEEGDRLYRVTGSTLDRIDGTLQGFEPGGVRFESVLGSKLFPWSEAAALFVEVLDAPAPRESPLAPVVLELVDGSRLRGRLERLDAQGVRLRLGGTSPVPVRWDEVEELVVDDGALGFLSALPAREEEGLGTPFDDDLGMRWPHQVDRSAIGTPLRAGGAVYGRGIGMHAPTRVRWSLDPRWDELRGQVAIDDSSLHNAEGARGSVVFRVRLDGALLWESPLVRGGEPPLALPRVSFPAGTAPRTLELEADPQDDFRGDRADWLRMLLVDRP